MGVRKEHCACSQLHLQTKHWQSLVVSGVTAVGILRGNSGSKPYIVPYSSFSHPSFSYPSSSSTALLSSTAWRRHSEQLMWKCWLWAPNRCNLLSPLEGGTTSIQLYWGTEKSPTSEWIHEFHLWSLLNGKVTNHVNYRALSQLEQLGHDYIQ